MIKVVKKLEEDGGDTDLATYLTNLGRSDEELKDNKSRIENELFDVLTIGERDNFDLDHDFIIYLTNLVTNVPQNSPARKGNCLYAIFLLPSLVCFEPVNL